VAKDIHYFRLIILRIAIELKCNLKSYTCAKVDKKRKSVLLIKGKTIGLLKFLIESIVPRATTIDHNMTQVII